MAVSNGNCFICGKTAGQIAIKNHLVKNHNIGNEYCYLFKAEGVYDKDCWLYFSVPFNTNMSTIDTFLREIWCECCDHLSAFRLGRDDFEMVRKITALEIGDKLLYEYDFGSTTRISLTVVDEICRERQNEKVQLLARNVPAQLVCNECGSSATYVEIYEGTYYCEACADIADEDMLMPTTNSPRCGVCGYDGTLDKWAFDPNKLFAQLDSSKPKSPKSIKQMKVLPHKMNGAASSEDSLHDEDIERRFDFLDSFFNEEIRPSIIKSLKSDLIKGESLDGFEETFLLKAEKAYFDIVSDAVSAVKEINFLLEQALKAHQDERYDDSARIFEMLLERFPEIDEYKVMLARAYMAAERFGKAIAVWEELYESEKGNHQYSLGLAQAYLDRGWHKKATSQFYETLNLDFGSVVAWEGLVFSYRYADNDQMALQACKEAISTLDEHNKESEVLYLYAFEIILAQGDKDSAESYVKLLISLVKNNAGYTLEKAERLISEFLDIIEEENAYEFLPFVHEIVELFPHIDKSVLYVLESMEVLGDINKLSESYPLLFEKLFLYILRNRAFSDREFDIVSIECCILADMEGYRPYVERIAEEYPRLYELNMEFFDRFLSNSGLKQALDKRMMLLSTNGLEPILSRADGSEIQLPNDARTYRRDGRKIGPNEKCPCGSGKKYKKCCRS